MAFSFVLAVYAAAAVLQDRFPDHLAMRVVSNHRDPRLFSLALPAGLICMASDVSGQPELTHNPMTTPRPWWNRLGIGSRPPSKAVVGKKAWIQWWERLRSLVLLAAVVAALGLMLAASIGLVIFLLGFLLEQAVS